VCLKETATEWGVGACLLLQSQQKKNYPGGYKTYRKDKRAKRRREEERFLFILAVLILLFFFLFLFPCNTTKLVFLSFLL